MGLASEALVIKGYVLNMTIKNALILKAHVATAESIPYQYPHTRALDPNMIPDLLNLILCNHSKLQRKAHEVFHDHLKPVTTNLLHSCLDLT